MFVSQKCQYALRAVFELARCHGQGSIKIARIAEAQAIPRRFLEVILSQLKQAGFVASQRGNKGGYFLTRPPDDLTVGEVMQFVQGPLGPVSCIVGDAKNPCPLYGNCAFLPMWKEVQKALSDIYDNTTFQDLIDQEKQKAVEGMFCYSI